MSTNTEKSKVETKVFSSRMVFRFRPLPAIPVCSITTFKEDYAELLAEKSWEDISTLWGYCTSHLLTGKDIVDLLTGVSK